MPVPQREESNPELPDSTLSQSTARKPGDTIRRNTTLGAIEGKIVESSIGLKVSVINMNLTQRVTIHGWNALDVSPVQCRV